MSHFKQLTDLSPPKVSFEFFPPKTEVMEQKLWSTIKELEPFSPEFVSVTYGAGGSTREKTHEIVKDITDKTSLSAAAHLTCIGSSKHEIQTIAKEYLDIGVNHIVALRGDPPPTDETFKPHPDGYNHAIDLVVGLKEIADFEISVAAFPEVHPEATNAEDDLQFLKEKIAAGADRAITQFFFDPVVYLDFLEKARKTGINVPIVPGIVLNSNFTQLVNFSKMCGANIPKWMYTLLGGLDDYPQRRLNIAAIIVAEQCRILREEGVDQFHFYTLNRPDIACSVCHILGIEYKQV